MLLHDLFIQEYLYSCINTGSRLKVLFKKFVLKYLVFKTLMLIYLRDAFFLRNSRKVQVHLSSILSELIATSFSRILRSIKCNARIYDLQHRRPVSDGDDVPDGIPFDEVQAALHHMGGISLRGGEHRASRYTRDRAINRLMHRIYQQQRVARKTDK